MQETIPTPCGAKLPTSATHFVNKNLVFSPSYFSLNENQVSLQWSNLEIISTHNFLGGSYLLNSCLSTWLHNQDLLAKALWVRANEQQQHCHVMCTIQQYYQKNFTHMENQGLIFKASWFITNLPKKNYFFTFLDLFGIIICNISHKSDFNNYFLDIKHNQKFFSKSVPIIIMQWDGDKYPPLFTDTE